MQSSKNFLMVVHCVQSMTEMGAGGISPGEHICWLHISQSSCLFSGEYYSLESVTTRLLKRVRATGQLYLV